MGQWRIRQLTIGYDSVQMLCRAGWYYNSLACCRAWQSENSIAVVRVLWEHVVWVRLPVLRLNVRDRPGSPPVGGPASRQVVLVWEAHISSWLVDVVSDRKDMKMMLLF